MEKSVKITLIIAITLIIMVFGSLFFVKSLIDNQDRTNTVTAAGQSKINVIPDLTSVYFIVETKNLTAEQAKNMNNMILDKVKTALVVSGIEENNIKTEQYSINENWEWDGSTSKKNGFVVQHSGKINLDNADKVGKVIDAIVDNGARINSVNFELSADKENYYKAEALKLATEDAKRKAEAIVSGLNKNLGSLISVQSSDFYYQPWPLYDAREGIIAIDKSEIQKAVNVNPSDKEITASVTVSYKIN